MKHLFVVAVLVLILPAAVFAHGVEVFDETGKPDVHTVRFGYTDGESMLFAKVKVFPPSSPDAAAQESVADRYGYFSFVPFETGDWRLTAEDGMGHKGEIVITVSDETAPEGIAVQNAAASHKLPTLVATALGLSLIINIFAFYNCVLKKSAGKKDGIHAH
jgi:uncharacterized GH25 family protein